MKTPSPLLGFNNNVRHKGRIFHIQTEDSGIKHPHIITHLFADGGRILKTVKTSYAEHLDSENIGETVRKMMQEQHKGMFTALRDGQFDGLIDTLGGGDRPLTGQHAVRPALATSPGASALVPPAPPSNAGMAIAEAAPAAPPQEEKIAAPIPAAPPPPPQEKIAPPPAPAPEAAPVLAKSLPIRQPTPPPLTRPSAGVDARSPAEREMAERNLNRAQSSFFQPIQEELPPPPEAVLPRRTPSSVRPIAPPMSSAFEPPTVPLGAPGRPRPSASLMSSRPTEGVSIFGEDLISEKSLDEVILSYLADDLDAPAESNKK